jgi:hypothetical protein
MTDIGKGDVVECISDFEWAPIKAGDRDVVVGLTAEMNCWTCGQRGAGLRLERAGVYLSGSMARGYCTCAWRKIGPGREEVVAMFAPHLTVTPERVDARAWDRVWAQWIKTGERAA